jgi:hypothetical protein
VAHTKVKPAFISKQISTPKHQKQTHLLTTVLHCLWWRCMPGPCSCWWGVGGRVRGSGEACSCLTGMCHWGLRTTHIPKTSLSLACTEASSSWQVACRASDFNGCWGNSLLLLAVLLPTAIRRNTGFCCVQLRLLQDPQVGQLLKTVHAQMLKKGGCASVSLTHMLCCQACKA